MNWQPIETAPKDGTQIFLLWRGRVVTGYFCDNVHLSHGKTVYERREWTFDGDTGLGRLLGSDRSEPTHWMPIPAPADVSPPEEVMA